MEGYVGSETQSRYSTGGCIHDLQAGIRRLGAAGRDPLQAGIHRLGAAKCNASWRFKFALCAAYFTPVIDIFRMFIRSLNPTLLLIVPRPSLC